MLERLSWKKLYWNYWFSACRHSFVTFFGYTGWFLAGALFAAAVWHSYNLLKLSDWLWLDRSMLPPPGRSSWEPIFTVSTSFSSVTASAAVNSPP